MINDKERIMNLVAEGVITTEEALILLENRQETTETTEETDKTTDEQTIEDFLNDIPNMQAITEKSSRDQKYQLQKKYEQELAQKLQEKQALLSEEPNPADDSETAILVKRLDEEINQLTEQVDYLKQEIDAMDRQQAKQEGARRQPYSSKQRETNHPNNESLIQKTRSGLHTAKKRFNQTVSFEKSAAGIPIPKLKMHAYEDQQMFAGDDLSVIDVNVTKGNITLETWEKSELSVHVSGQLVGDYEEDTALEAFQARSELSYEAGTLQFNLLSRLLTSHVTIKIPKQAIDYVKLHSLTGKMTINGLACDDLMMQSLDGDIVLNGVTAQMVELNAKNSRIEILDADITDLISKNLNGDQRLIGIVQNAELQTGNGDVRLTYSEAPKRLLATSKNGDLKCHFPEHTPIDGFAQTNSGAILFRNDDLTIRKLKDDQFNHQATFQYRLEDQPTYVTLKTISGNVQVKGDQ